jgi:hypothetical protein
MVWSALERTEQATPRNASGEWPIRNQPGDLPVGQQHGLLAQVAFSDTSCSPYEDSLNSDLRI